MHDDEFTGRIPRNRAVDHATDQLKERNVAILSNYMRTEGRVSIRFEDHGDTVVLRIPQKLTVEFFTRRNRWKVRGQKKTTHGTVDQFIAWFVRNLHGGA